MKQAYVNKTFSRSSQALIDQANEIIEEYQAQGFSLTQSLASRLPDGRTTCWNESP